MTTLAQSDGELQALQAEVRVLRAGQAAMQKQLAEIKQLLSRAARGRTETAFQPQQITVADAPYLGRPDAAVTLVEFTDYQCPFCRRHSAQTKPRLIKDYVATGKLRYVLREFPLARIHPQATKAAEAALCAGDQDKYWDLNAVFFANQRKLKPTDLLAYADNDLGLWGFDGEAPSFVGCWGCWNPLICASATPFSRLGTDIGPIQRYLTSGSMGIRWPCREHRRGR